MDIPDAELEAPAKRAWPPDLRVKGQVWRAITR